MKLTFIGADHEVTGSCTHLDICGKHVLIDYGMEQGKDFYQNAPLPELPGEIDAVLAEPPDLRQFRALAERLLQMAA